MLRISELPSFLFRDDQFDFLLSLFANRIHFDLTVEQCCLYNETIDFIKIAQRLQ
jgi:hypothetical protein